MKCASGLVLFCVAVGCYDFGNLRAAGDRGPDASEDASDARADSPTDSGEPSCGRPGQPCCAGNMCSTGASCLSGVCGSSDVWAVGQNNTVLHWNGSSWSAVLGPLGTHFFQDAWYGDGTVWACSDDGVVFSYTGGTWDERGVFGRPMFGAWGAGAGGANAVWVVGTYSGTVPGNIWKWNGFRFVGLTSYPTTNTLWGVAGTGASDVYAVGDGAIVHTTDGVSWSTVFTPTLTAVTYFDVWADAANDVWAVGGQSGGAAQIAHWNGSVWTTEAPLAMASVLYGVYASNPTDVWAVGSIGSSAQPLMMHRATSWTAVTPSPTPSVLLRLWGDAAGDVWGVGEAGTAAHYNGTSWTIYNPTTNALKGVWGSIPP